MVFARKVFAPGPGTGRKATFRWRPFQSALSGSLFFIPPPLVEISDYIFSFMTSRRIMG
jgi:hypothetical protein